MVVLNALCFFYDLVLPIYTDLLLHRTFAFCVVCKTIGLSFHVACMQICVKFAILFYSKICLSIITAHFPFLTSICNLELQSSWNIFPSTFPFSGCPYFFEWTTDIHSVIDIDMYFIKILAFFLNLLDKAYISIDLPLLAILISSDTWEEKYLTEKVKLWSNPSWLNFPG